MQTIVEMKALPSSREEAEELGSTAYFTGEACRNGHLSPRNTKKAKCVACLNEAQARRRERNPGEDAQISARYRARNMEMVRAMDRKRYQEDPEGRKKHIRAYNLRFPDRLALNRGYRNGSVLRATPKWLTEKHHQKIRDLYLTARRLTRESGMSFEVDHIEPINGRVSCGLHVPWNLQVITATSNRRKSNNLAA
jgi:hypothetical protein